ncbi:hypothetical protein, partial [Stenotrophomonas maltophilia]|uniref:hypothetical protein n=1 Tax=Stenotrophomonas maltophilia TaxID=40324 RepID=UPI001954BB41
DYALLSAGIDGKRMGRAFSVHTFAGFLGTAVAPALLMAIAALAGIKTAFAVSGLLGFAVAALLLTGPATVAGVPRDRARAVAHADAGKARPS